MRALFGGDPNLNETNGIVRLNKASQTVTIWDAETGGTQYTNLLAFDGTTAISSVTSTGRTLAPFYGEDNDIAHAWADTGDGDRELILGTFPGAALSAAIGWVAGLVDDDTTDNRAAIQAALDQGGRWMLPPTAGRYAIAGTLVMDTPGTELIAWGAPVRQATRGETLIDAVAPDCKIDGLDWTGGDGSPDFTGLNTGSWQGTIPASAWCAVNVYDTAHRLAIPWIKGRGGSSVVRIGAWTYAADTAATTALEDVTVGTVLADAVEFGLTAKGTRRLTVDVVKGTYGNVLNSSRPGHLFYLADDTNSVQHSQPSIGRTIATNGQTGSAVQIKGVVDGGTVDRIEALGCLGSVSLMDNTDLYISTIVSIGDTFDSTAGGSITLDAAIADTRTHIGKALIRMAGNGRPARFLSGTDLVVDELRAEVNHSTTGSSTEYDVEVRGERATLGTVSINNIGTDGAWKGVGIWSGSGHRVHIAEAWNVRSAFDARDSDALITYDRDRVTLHPTAGYLKANAGYPTGTIRTPQSLAFMSGRDVLVADDFTTSTDSALQLYGTITGHAWDRLAGSWRLDGETMRAYEFDATINAAAVVDAGAADVAVEVAFTSENSEGIIVRATDVSNYLTARLHRSGGNLDIMKRVAGANTVLSSTAVTTTQGRRYSMRMEVYGAEVKVYLDGVLIVTYTLTGGDETTFAAQTKHGLRSSGSAASRFDSFRVLSLT